MPCDMCGKEGELFFANVEGARLKVCPKCSVFGKVISKVTIPTAARPTTHAAKEAPEKTIVEGYGTLIKRKREEMGLNQADFAKKLLEKESVIHKIEVEDIELPIALAEKLEKALKVKLIESNSSEPVTTYKAGKDEMTLGDLVKVRKR